MRRSMLFVVLTLIAATMSCGGSDSSTEPTNNGQTGTALNGTFAATIGSVNWSAQGTVTVNKGTNNFIGLAGSGVYSGSNAYAVVLGIGQATGPGTYSLNLGTGGGSSLVIGSSTGQGWGTAFNGGTGSVTITTLTANHIVGTFTADAVPGTGGATGTLQVRNGRFDITF